MNRTANQFEGLLARYFETLLQDNPTFSTICAGPGLKSAPARRTGAMCPPRR